MQLFTFLNTKGNDFFEKVLQMCVSMQMKLMKKELIISISLLIISFSPIFILGKQSWITIHDNLDSEFVYLHLLKESNNLFSLNEGGIVPQIFNGLSTKYFHSEFSFIRVLYYVFPSFWAYVLNSFLVRLIGVIGMSLLISTYYKDRKIPTLLKVFIPLSFGLLPIYSLCGISVMGQPILLWSFLNLKSSIRVSVSLIIIFLFPFYAHFAMTAPFLLIAVFLYGLGLVLLKRKISISYFLGIGVLFFSFIMANYITINNFIFNDIVSHRTEWSFKATGWHEIFKTFINTLIYGHYHSAKMFALPVLLLGAHVVLKKHKGWRSIALIIFALVGISFIYSIYDSITVPLKEQLHLLTSFNFNRFTFLYPLLCYILLIKCINAYNKINVYVIIITLLFFAGSLAFNNEIKINASKLISTKSGAKKINSFSNFYAEDLFQEINNYIGIPQKQYRVVSLGFHPSIAQYNGFYTLDSYQNNYPLSYKMEFRKIIEGELEKNQKLKYYFDSWGSRCYLFSSELRENCYLDCNTNNNTTINELDININQLKKMGGRYILSAVRILNADKLNLKFEKLFESNQTSINIYLYSL
jgi:hypothetical protein